MYNRRSMGGKLAMSRPAERGDGKSQMYTYLKFNPKMGSRK